MSLSALAAKNTKYLRVNEQDVQTSAPGHNGVSRHQI